MADPVEEMFIRLGLDGLDFLSSLERHIQAGVDIAEKGGGQIAEVMAEAMRSGTEGLGAQVVAFAEDLSLSLEEAAEKMESLAVAGGRTRAELLELAQAYQSEVLKNFTTALNDAETELADQGRISDETAAQLAAYTVQVGLAGVKNDQLAGQVQRANTVLADYTRGQEGAGEATEQSATFLGLLGQGLETIATKVVGALTIVKLFSEIKQTLDEAVESAIRFSEVNFRLEVAVRAAQRAQGEGIGTIREYKQFADGLTETYGIQRELTYSLIGTTLRLTNELGLAKEEVQGLAEAAAVMNQVAGIDAQSALFRFTQFINTGYARGLSLMGFAVDRATQQQVALALGITKPIREWTREEQTLVRVALIQQQVNRYAEDAKAGQEVLAKRLEVANIKWQDTVRILGEFLAPTIVTIKEALTDLAVTAVQAATIVAYSLKRQQGQLEAAYAGSVAGEEAYRKAIEEGATKQEAILARDLAVRTAYARELAIQDAALAEEIRQAMGSLGDATLDASEQQRRAAAEMTAAMEKAESDIATALDELVADYNESAAEIEENFYERLADLDRDLARNLEDAARDLSRDLTDIDTDAARERVEAIREAQRDELRLREDHQIALRELERKYLFELEDAVRERDARGVLMLQRRYNEDRRKEMEEYRLRQRRRREDLALELKEIEVQRQQRRADRIIEYQQELADIREQDERKRADAELARRREQEDLQESLKRKVDALVKAALAENQLQASSLENLRKRLMAYLGPGGANDLIYRYAISSVMNYAAALSTALSGSTNPNLIPEGLGLPTSGGSSGRTYLQHGYQAGGSFVATSPQSITVGERPEQVTVSPLNRATGAPIAGFGGGGRDRIRIDLALRLSEGLLAEVVDQALNETAEVIVSMTKAETSGMGATRAGGRQ
jgi:hypothetical protein